MKFVVQLLARILTGNNFVRPIRENWRFLSSIVPKSNTVYPIAKPQSFRGISHHFPNNNSPFRLHRWRYPDLSIPSSVWANRDNLQVVKYRQWPDAAWQSHIPFDIIHFQGVRIRCDKYDVDFRSIGSVDTRTEWSRRSDVINVTTIVAHPNESIFSIPMRFSCNRLHRHQNDVFAVSMRTHR